MDGDSGGCSSGGGGGFSSGGGMSSGGDCGGGGFSSGGGGFGGGGFSSGSGFGGGGFSSGDGFSHGSGFDHHGPHGVHGSQFSSFPMGHQTHVGYTNQGFHSTVHTGTTPGNVTYIQQPGMMRPMGYQQNRGCCIVIAVFSAFIVISIVMFVSVRFAV